MRSRPDPSRVAVLAALASLLPAVVSLCLAAGAAPAGAQPASPGKTIQGEERARLMEEIRRRQSEVTALSARVVQRKRHPLLENEVVSEGTLRYRRPNLLRWEVAGPVRIVVVMDGRTMTSYYPDRKEAFRRGLGDDMVTHAAAEFLAAGMGGSFADLEKRFRLELLRDGDGVVVRLMPRSRWLARGLSSIDIHHGSRDAVPTRIVVAGTRGDRTETRLLDVTVNPTFAKDPFVLDLGPDVRITDVGRSVAGADDGA